MKGKHALKLYRCNKTSPAKGLPSKRIRLCTAIYRKCTHTHYLHITYTTMYVTNATIIGRENLYSPIIVVKEQGKHFRWMAPGKISRGIGIYYIDQEYLDNSARFARYTLV